MPINPNASIEITAFKWVPQFAQGRGARPARPLGAGGSRARLSRPPARPDQRPTEYLKEQPFDQVPCFSDGTRQDLRERSDRPIYRREERGAAAERPARASIRAIQWTYAALNSVRAGNPQPPCSSTVFFTGEEWAKLRRPGAEDFAKLKLKRVSDWLGDKQWLEGDRFTIGDLIMVTVLRFLRHTGSGRRVRQSRRLREARRSASGLQAGAGRPARPVRGESTPTPTRRSSSMTYFEGFVAPVPEANKDAYRKHSSDFAPICQEIRRPPNGRIVGRRRARRQGHRLQESGECEARRNGRFLVLRISLESRSRRSEREVHERPAHGGHGREHAVRRQAHDHGRLRSDRRGRLGRRQLHRRLRRPGAARKAGGLSRARRQDGESLSSAWRDARDRGASATMCPKARSPTSIVQ